MQCELSRLPDGELMDRLAKGEVEVLGALFLRHGDAVMRFLHRILNEAASTEDVCQEVFLAVHQSARRYEEQGKLRSWIFKIAARKARAHNRRVWVRGRLMHQAAQPDRQTAAEGSRGTNMLDLSRAFTALPQKLREVLALHVGEGMNGDQIAQALGISAGAVRVRLHRARQAMSIALGYVGQAGASDDCRDR